jgi:hypothetical protein
MQEPSGLVRRSVVHPTPLWTWSLVWRNGEDNPAVRAVIDEFTRDARELGWMTRGRGCRPQIRIGARESAPKQTGHHRRQQHRRLPHRRPSLKVNER